MKRDGSVVAQAELGVAVAVDPGEHTVGTQMPGGPLEEVKVTLGKKEKKTVMLPSAGGQSVASWTRRARRRTASRGRMAGLAGTYIAGAVGVAGLILGGVAGRADARQEEHDRQELRDRRGPGKACTDEGLVAVLSANTLGRLSDVGFIAGAAGAVATGVLLIVAPRAPKRVSTTASHRGFVRLGVQSVGREGVTFGFGGGW